MKVSMKVEDSPNTDDNKLVNTTKVLERDLMHNGLLTRRVSETDLITELEQNAFCRGYRPRRRCLSLSDLVGNLTLDRMNSDSSFESEEQTKINDRRKSCFTY